LINLEEEASSPTSPEWGNRLHETPDPEVLADLVSFIEGTDDLIGVSDPWGRITYLNRAARKRLGVGDADDLTISDVFPLDAFEIYFEQARPELIRRGAWSGVVPVTVGDGRAVPMLVSTTMRVGPGGENLGTVLVARDLPRGGEVVGEHDVAQLDDAASVLDRAAFESQMEKVLDPSRAGGDSYTLVVCDVSSLTVASHLGREVVDQVMRALGARLVRIARIGDIVGRVAPDRFAFLPKGIRGRRSARHLGEAVKRELTEMPVETTIGSLPVAVTCTVVFDADERGAMGMLRTTGSDSSVTEPQAQSTSGGPTLETLRLGFAQGDVRTWAQPVVDVHSGEIVAYRGVPRWRHKSFGMIGAVDIAQLASDTALAAVIDVFTLRELATLLVFLTRDGTLDLYLPASRRFFADVRSEQQLDEIEDAFSLFSQQVHLEVGFQSLEDGAAPLRDALRSHADAGVSLVLVNLPGLDVAVHDYPELGFRELHLAPDVVGDPSRRVAAKALVDRAHQVGLRVGAAGLTSEEQRNAAIEIGCDRAFGDIYGPSQSVEALEEQ
jgi:EAL domain-containing protein (putative c-di-GMP-specific phosphodiesterase class I)/GGDEF domain-containing protein